MSGVILTLLDQPAAAPALLNAASYLAKLVGNAAVQGLIIRTPPEATIVPSEEVLTARHADKLRAQEQARATALTDSFNDWRQRTGQPAQLTNVEAAPDEAVLHHGAAADFIVAARPANHPHGVDQPAIRTALFGTDRPVLLVPPNPGASFGQVIAVAWRDDGHVVKAVLPALHLLTGATRVHVLHGVRDGSVSMPLPDVFRQHGIAAQMHVLAIGDGVFGQALLDQAHALRADLLVMGAYGHNPLREMLFGGVTRFMLEHADLPVLLRH